jgi:hypothetical protein
MAQRARMVRRPSRELDAARERMTQELLWSEPNRLREIEVSTGRRVAWSSGPEPGHLD